MHALKINFIMKKKHAKTDAIMVQSIKIKPADLSRISFLDLTTH